MDPLGTGWDERQLEWFTSWVKKGTWNKGTALPEGFTFEDFQAHDSEPVNFGLLPMSGFQIEKVGNAAPSRKDRRSGTPSQDGTDSMQMVAKSLKAIRTLHCLDHEGKDHEVGGLVDSQGEPVGTKVNLDVVRGLPDWQILEITDHIELVRVQQEKSAKN